MEERETDIINRLITGVRDMDEKKTIHAAREALKINVEPLRAINEGLVVGMNQAGLLYDKEEYFVPELLLCSDALYSGLDILSPHLKPDTTRTKTKVVIGVVEGDTHDIGKNLVKLMLDVSGFDVCDLGRDVPLNIFVSKVIELKAELLCMSTLMSTTMNGMGAVIRGLEREGVRDSVKVMVGGGPLSKSFADKIGADGYSKNATGAVKLACQLSMIEDV
jgi:dimethylamine corrinoid protein